MLYDRVLSCTVKSVILDWIAFDRWIVFYCLVVQRILLYGVVLHCVSLFRVVLWCVV